MPIPVFDLHCDTADSLAWHTLPADLLATCGRGFSRPGAEAEGADCSELARSICHLSLEKVGETPWAQCMACFIPDELSPEQAVRFHAHVSDHLATQVEKNAGRATFAHSAAEVRAALEASRFAVVRTIENARLFAADLGLVSELAEQGLAVASLSWNAAGPLASGMDSHAGLSALGRQALAEMERAGVTLDVSHLNDEGFADVAALARRPFVATHSNARAVRGHPRNLTDDQFLEIRDRGGLVGLNFCPAFLAEGARGGADVGFEQVAAHVEHWLKLGGEDAVALGSDYDGTHVPAFLDGADKIPAFQVLLAERFGERVTEKLCWENAVRFLERAWA